MIKALPYLVSSHWSLSLFWSLPLHLHPNFCPDYLCKHWCVSFTWFLPPPILMDCSGLANMSWWLTFKAKAILQIWAQCFVFNWTGFLNFPSALVHKFFLKIRANKLELGQGKKKYLRLNFLSIWPWGFKFLPLKIVEELQRHFWCFNFYWFYF